MTAGIAGNRTWRFCVHAENRDSLPTGEPAFAVEVQDDGFAGEVADPTLSYAKQNRNPRTSTLRVDRIFRLVGD